MIASLMSLFVIVNLGVHGSVYPVQEPDLLLEIEQKAKTPAVQSAINESTRKSYVADIYLPDAKTSSKRTITMRYTVPEDLVIDGNVIARRGQVVDVLEKVKITTKYLFIKEQHIPLFLKLAKKDRNTVAVVIQGDLHPLIERYPEHRIYMGSSQLIDKFGLTAVPSLVYQEGRHIVVEEIPYLTRH